MLKALELCGFKSFADKTRFEFPPGITVVVGPNGSGKSNIVDAVKWVLGEQSAKSLRGREMADVIFKGSGGGSALRRPAATAEVTIVFDNSSGTLGIDTEEVRVSRSVYRSGEGEYAINGNPCRLRDVKDLFRGTGMGTDAYSLIEQGKVDTLLQATPRDRRAIFEEAAGISRFKAKKVETQRRLERVEQNLERLSDIVDEVESQLRTVRNQASKARRYQEYTERLKALRTHVGMADWRRFSAELETLDVELSTVNAQTCTLQDQVAQTDRRVQALDQEATRLDTLLQDAEATSAKVRQDLARSQSTVHHEYQRLDELQDEISRYRRQWRILTARASELAQQVQHLQDQVTAAEADDRSIRTRLDKQQRNLNACEEQLQTCQRQRDENRAEHAHQLRVLADAERRIGVLESELQSVQDQIQRAELQRESHQQQGTESRERLTELEGAQRSLEEAEQAARDALDSARDGLHNNERQLNQQQQKAVDLQRQLAVATERAKVLQDLERRHEGLSHGVKDLLLKAQDAPLGPLASVRGMIADLIRVDVRMAPMIDASLGELTQYVVVDGDALMTQLASGDLALQGRVGLIDLRIVGDPPADPPSFSSDRSVLGRADRFVEAEAQYDPLILRLLARTWCVESLNDALRLRKSVDRPLRFVTRSGEILETDGSLLAGPRQAAMGLVSRRSELRSLKAEIAELQPRLDATESKIKQLRDEISASAQQVDATTRGYDEAASALMNARLATRAAADRVANLEQLLEETQTELQRQTQRRDEAAGQLEVQSTKLQQTQALVEHLETTLAQQQNELLRLEQQRGQEHSTCTEIKVELAKSEQRVDGLRNQLVKYREDQRERERSLAENQSQLQSAEQRHLGSQRTILSEATLQAECYLISEQQDGQITEVGLQRAELFATRKVCQQELNELREQLQETDQRRHALDLEINRLRLERELLAQRVRDDYDVELSEVEDLPPESEDEQRQRDEIDREIGDLRRRLSNMGAVNMAALEEIEGLEQRHRQLSEQYQDLVQAKESLARIIHKINADSRRLFTESLEAIRTNFQGLFRRVFGGGHADIVLEEGMDILEAGIDIVATPPGKHSLGISLLSGGERALTAVTLLLAIFQYRPSPFCVLDEVDGPLDETNIGRFIDVLNEFLQWTKFVVVTHSKKTMTAAHTLYGVTMQESGVSKRVSVQFEDVSEDGHIRQEALDRGAPPANRPDDDDERGAA